METLYLKIAILWDYCINTIGNKDILVQNDGKPNTDGQLCTGFMLIKSNDKTKQFFNYNLVKNLLNINYDDQDFFNANKKFLDYDVLPLNLYPNGRQLYFSLRNYYLELNANITGNGHSHHPSNVKEKLNKEELTNLQLKCDMELSWFENGKNKYNIIDKQKETEKFLLDNNIEYKAPLTWGIGPYMIHFNWCKGMEKEDKMKEYNKWYI